MAGLSERYAAALFDLSIENGRTDLYAQQAAIARDVLKSEDCQSLLTHPHIADAEKQRFLQNIFNRELEDDLMGFFYLLIAKSREHVIVPALTKFIELAERYKGKTVASIVSAVDLDENRIMQIQKTLSRKLNKNVEIMARTDPSVIGGLYVLTEGYLLDHTVKHRLNELKNYLKAM